MNDQYHNEKGNTMMITITKGQAPDTKAKPVEDEAKKMECPECGEDMPMDAEKCPKCGAEMAEEEDAESPVEDTKDEEKSAGPFDVKRFTVAPGREDIQVESDAVEDSIGVDYRNVRIKGYLTTWEHVTPKDRDGEYVVKGAFKGSLAKFMEDNPIMLRDHKNITDNVAGSFTLLREDDRGLYFEATLSNAPGMRDHRVNIVEKHLRAVSMGGVFKYNRAGKGITEVALFEGTLTPIPANPDARFQVFDVTPKGKAYLAGGGTLAGLKAFEMGDTKANPNVASQARDELAKFTCKQRESKRCHDMSTKAIKRTMAMIHGDWNPEEDGENGDDAAVEDHDKAAQSHAKAARWHRQEGDTFSGMAHETAARWHSDFKMLHMGRRGRPKA